MKKKVIVISLGGSRIIPNEVNFRYLKEFKRILLKNKKYKFIVVCGGGSLARKYIRAMKAEGFGYDFQSYTGIAATRTNARFVSYFFGYGTKYLIPKTIEELKRNYKKMDIVFSGALDYKPRQTTDSTAAEIASYFNADFINLTNVQGLYNKNPKKYKNAKFISEIAWKNFDIMTSKMGYKPGQHFVLDLTSSKIIMKNKIKTHIIGSIKELDNFLKGKKYKGTLIGG